MAIHGHILQRSGIVLQCFDYMYEHTCMAMGWYTTRAVRKERCNANLTNSFPRLRQTRDAEALLFAVTTFQLALEHQTKNAVRGKACKQIYYVKA